MTNQQKLTKVIEYAIENGYKLNYIWTGKKDRKNELSAMCEGFIEMGMVSILLFSHKFAKTVFGEEPACGNPNCKDCPGTWTHRISDAVISKDPLDYYYQFVKG